VKILVYGAGVIGSLYAGKLQAGSHSVTVLAWGDRLSEIRHYGLVLQDVISGGQTAIKVVHMSAPCHFEPIQRSFAMYGIPRKRISETLGVYEHTR
jgi:ketopantoate reductase